MSPRIAIYWSSTTRHSHRFFSFLSDVVRYPSMERGREKKWQIKWRIKRRERRVEWFIEQEKWMEKKRRNDACVVIKIEEDAAVHHPFESDLVELWRDWVALTLPPPPPLSIGRPRIDTHRVRNEADGLGFSTLYTSLTKSLYNQITILTPSNKFFIKIFQ